MFDALTHNLGSIFDKLKGRGYLSEDDVNAALREVRIALLEADVALPVVKDFIAKAKEKAVGEAVVKSVSPVQMVIKIVHDTLTETLGGESPGINLATTPPAVIMMVGLQGSGKTTSTAKLALHLRKKHKSKILLVSLDVYRPAAQEQLAVLGRQVEIDTLPIIAGQQPLDIAKRGLETGKREGYDIIMLDTAGRLHIDEALMQELQAVKAATQPVETLLVADSLTGQDAVNIAEQFNNQVNVTGIILTRVDGDGRGGAALSMRAVTGQPVKFLGTGEKLNEFEEFHPDRLSSRILGMGDIVSLVEKAVANVDQAEAEKLAKKMQKGKFDLEDLAAQFRTMRKMGGVGQMLNLIPGLGKFKQQIEDANVDGTMLKWQEAIISSMTPQERRNPDIINAKRKLRIAAGCGRPVQEINRLLKQHREMAGMMKKFSKMDKKTLLRSGGLGNLLKKP